MMISIVKTHDKNFNALDSRQVLKTCLGWWYGERRSDSNELLLPYPIHTPTANFSKMRNNTKHPKSPS